VLSVKSCEDRTQYKLNASSGFTFLMLYRDTIIIIVHNKEAIVKDGFVDSVSKDGPLLNFQITNKSGQVSIVFGLRYTHNRN